MPASHQAWGHSMLVDPWGKVEAKTEEKEDIVVCDVDLSKVGAVRSAIPTFGQKRYDLYKGASKL